MIELIMFMLLLAMVMFAWVGFQLGQAMRGDGDDELDAQREALRVEWEAVERCRQIDDVYSGAQEAMRRTEAESQPRPPRPGVVDGQIVEVREYRPPWNRQGRDS